MYEILRSHSHEISPRFLHMLFEGDSSIDGAHGLKAIQRLLWPQTYVSNAAREHGAKLEVIKLPEAKRGIVLLPRRWGCERSFGRMSRFRWLAHDYERLPEILTGLRYPAFIVPTLKNMAEVLA
jgi:transposase